MCSTTEMAQGKTAGAAIYVGPMAFESIVFCLTAWKAYVAVTSRRTLYTSPLHQIFFRGAYDRFFRTTLLLNREQTD